MIWTYVCSVGAAFAGYFMGHRLGYISGRTEQICSDRAYLMSNPAMAKAEPYQERYDEKLRKWVRI